MKITNILPTSLGLLFSMFVFSISFAQKFDNVWLFGYNSYPEDVGTEAFNLIFDTFPPRIEKSNTRKAYLLVGGSSICDSIGDVLLYTNNCKIFGPADNVVQGGDTLTKGWELQWCDMYGDHPYHYYNIFLPAPEGEHKVYFFNKATFKSDNAPLVIYQHDLKYSIIDMSKNNGEGKVIVKDRTIIDDKFGYGQFTAVKHGNGRDWWLPMPVDIGNKIHISLLTKDTAYLHHSQHIGPAWDRNGGFQASFSPDGSKYVRYNRFHGVFIYDFDRCNGMLSNLVHFPFNDTTQGIYGGCAISPNNRFLYVADFDYLYQFDLWANDILNSKELIGIYDGHISSLWTKFSYIINAPDGRMYIIPPNTTSAIHVINRPNLPGVDCDFRQHDIEFPYPYGNTPIFPNFRLGPLDGSPCDTLGLDNHPLADFRPEPTDTSGLAMHFWDVSAYEPAEWLWEFGDGASSQGTSPVHAYASPGFYTVCLTVANQYGSDTKCKVVEVKMTSGMSGLHRAWEVRIFPNPTSGVVSFSGMDASGYMAEVYDVAGLKLVSAVISGNSLDLSNLPSGIYLLRLTSPNGGVAANSKVVISK